jgi:hypothetical protein
MEKLVGIEEEQTERGFRAIDGGERELEVARGRYVSDDAGWSVKGLGTHLCVRRLNLQFFTELCNALEDLFEICKNGTTISRLPAPFRHSPGTYFAGNATGEWRSSRAS